ncbi:EAL domain-containing protein [Luteimonas fraxinea]|uniref:EAL domain-containing protein n=1 Tax=Luteimonas fraxinea TaxID=2901869 RepID=A0ABS8U9F0_9GAMM|nr:EAL domain-containing protein [Luteimonas fraxinea]MCD9095396.1 EAL domain-containing protein [Luteimonas fraxinea]MCD9126364.1 EAL domain-containing protein [Luteimonas fraxinea]UHH11868.1 EAL domain-containing protein [Luteimonas fraxinea]
MAFQPIVDARDRSIFGYEALVRSAMGGGAGEVIARVTPDQLYRFDQTCRVKAIETAARLGLQQRLSINFFPNAVYEPAACIRLTLAAAQAFGFPTNMLVFETAESERVRSHDHLTKIFRDYRSRGFMTAIDDFGAGYAGLSLLADFQPDLLKLDMALVRNVHVDANRVAIIRGIVQMSEALGSTVLAEGVEQVEEYLQLRELGVPLFQGYLFGKPRLEVLEGVSEELWNRLDAR